MESKSRGPIAYWFIYFNEYLKHNFVLDNESLVFEYEWAKEIKDVPATIDSVNDELKKYVNDHGLVYLDYFSSMVDERKGLNKDYTYDGVHPNQDGYILMSSLAEKVLSRLLHWYYLEWPNH